GERTKGMGGYPQFLDRASRRKCAPTDELLREMTERDMKNEPQLLDVVALLRDLPEAGLVRGQVGTVVELLDGAYEVEFSDEQGKTYAMLAIKPEQLLVLHHRPQQAA